MKHLLIIILILISGATILGQVIIVPGGATGGFGGRFRKDNKTLIEYDSSKDYTSVHSPYFLLYKSQGSMMYSGELLAGSFKFMFKGRTLSAPPLSLEFRANWNGNHTWKFDKEKYRKLTIAVDDKNIIEGVMERVWSNQYPDSNAMRMRFEEIMTIPVSFEDFTRICNGKKIIIQIRKDYKSKLQKNEIEILRKFLTLAKG